MYVCICVRACVCLCMCVSVFVCMCVSQSVHATHTLTTPRSNAHSPRRAYAQPPSSLTHSLTHPHTHTRSDWEGGIRTAAFISGGLIPPTRRGGVFEGVVSIADWYATFCELAGADPTDIAAMEANDWLRERVDGEEADDDWSRERLPLLPAIDSVSQWKFFMSGDNGRQGPLHLSENAILHW